MLLHPRFASLPDVLVQLILEFLYPQLEINTDFGKLCLSVVINPTPYYAWCFLNVRHIPPGFQSFVRTVPKELTRMSVRCGFYASVFCVICSGIVLGCSETRLVIRIRECRAITSVGRHKVERTSRIGKDKGHYPEYIKPNSILPNLPLTTEECERCTLTSAMWSDIWNRRWHLDPPDAPTPTPDFKPVEETYRMRQTTLDAFLV